MTHETHNRIIALGFVMLYVGVMGLLLTLTTELPEGVVSIVRMALGGASAIGSVLIAAAKLSPIRD